MDIIKKIILEELNKLFESPIKWKNIIIPIESIIRSEGDAEEYRGTDKVRGIHDKLASQKGKYIGRLEIRPITNDWKKLPTISKRLSKNPKAKWLLSNGHHRLTAYEELGYEKVPAKVPLNMYQHNKRKFAEYQKALIKLGVIRENFSPAPKMGDIDPTSEKDNKKRPGMKNRPSDGMDISQHHKMMWAENKDFDQDDGDDDETLEEMVAISTGGAGLASSGQVGATSGGSAWEEKNKDHELMWSGDKPLKKKRIDLNESFKLPEEILDGTGNDYDEDGIVVKNIPMKALSMLEEQGEGIINDIQRGETSKTPGLPVLYFDLEKKQLIVDDGNHRIFQDWLNGKNYFDAIVYSSSWNDYLRPVYDGEEKFNWDESYRNEDEELEELDEELIGKSKNGGPTYFQMGGSLPDKLYNRKNGKPSRDPGVLNIKKEGKEEGSPSKPSHRDLEDAIEHASFEMGADIHKNLFRVTLSDFNLSYLGELSIAQLKNYDDLSSWMDDIEDEEDLIAFRGPKWAVKALSWKKSVPPIVVVTSDDPPYSSISDGRGRVTYANYKKLPVPTWELKWKGTIKGESPIEEGVAHLKENKEEVSSTNTTSHFKVGDKIFFGKYKNKKGKIVSFGKDDKGNPTITIEPELKPGTKKKKKNQVMGLYKIWKQPAKD